MDKYILIYCMSFYTKLHIHYLINSYIHMQLPECIAECLVHKHCIALCVMML